MIIFCMCVMCFLFVGGVAVFHVSDQVLVADVALDQFLEVGI